MILVDVNLLVYAHVDSIPQNSQARPWLDEQLNDATRVGLPWPSLIGFLRLVTNPRIFRSPSTVEDAWRQVEEWLRCEASWVPMPTERHATLLGQLLADSGVHGNLVHDAHLAALALEHGLTLCSADSDFAKFPGLRWENPLQH